MSASTDWKQAIATELYNYVDITPYLHLPQETVANMLGMSKSTFSRRWREASRGRYWPCRRIEMIQTQINALLMNIEEEAGISNSTKDRIIELITLRNDLLQQTFIRTN